MDFRNLNAVTVRDSFSLPRIDDLLHKVGQAKVFSKMDLQSGFYQVLKGLRPFHLLIIRA